MLPRKPAATGRLDGDWSRRDVPFLRRAPTDSSAIGRETGRRRIEELFIRLRRDAPAVFADAGVSLHSYRHAIATFVDSRFGRSMTRAVLGHVSHLTPTDAYVRVSPADLRAAIEIYESHLLAETRPASLSR